MRLLSAALSGGWNLVRRWALFADFLLFVKALKGGGQYAACFSRLTLMVRLSGRLKSVGGSLCPILPTAEGDAWMNVVEAQQAGTAQPTLSRIRNEKRPARPVPFTRLIRDQRIRRLLAMKNKSPKKKSARPKRILHLPYLDHAKVDVLNTRNSPDSQRSYRFAIEEFIAWYC